MQVRPATAQQSAAAWLFAAILGPLGAACQPPTLAHLPGASATANAAQDSASALADAKDDGAQTQADDGVDEGLGDIDSHELPPTDQVDEVQDTPELPGLDADGSTGSEVIDDNMADSADSDGEGLDEDTAKPCPLSCDDQNPCTQDGCDTGSGKCTHLALGAGAGCDDGNAGTAGDWCKDGVCQPGEPVAECQQTSDCAKMDDGDLCNGTLFCNKALLKCQINPASVVVCPSAWDTPCAKSMCKPTTGVCEMVAVAEGSACDDGNTCTKGEVCKAGSCQASGGANTCSCQADADCKAWDDGDNCNGTLFCVLATGSCMLNPASVVVCPSVKNTACSKNTCNPTTGQCSMLLASDATPCDADGSACTQGDQCLAGVCVSGVNTCACQQDADCNAQEDGNQCNGTLICDKQKGACTVNPASVVACPSVADTACKKNLCDPGTGACVEVATASGVACDDGAPCTVGDVCLKGTCQAGVNQCLCDADTDCADDGNPCNGKPKCDLIAGQCVIPPKSVVVCPTAADTPCTKNLCQPQTGQCAMTAVNVNGPCSDQDPCTLGDTCDKAGSCVPGDDVCACHLSADCTPLDDGNACNGVLFCDKTATPFACAVKPGTVPPDGAKCEDGWGCTSGESCQAGQCTPGSSSCLCTADAQCSQVSPCVGKALCNKQTGTCWVDTGAALKCSQAGLGPCAVAGCDATQAQCVTLFKAATEVCDDGDACTTGDHCPGNAGVCTGASALNCDDGKPCTDDSCEAAAGCIHLATQATCSDGDACTAGDLCQAGSCSSGAKIACSDEDACTADACSPKDGCQFSPPGPGACDDGLPCTVDGCDPKQGCTHGPLVGACSDGDSCTVGDSCKAGVCLPGAVTSCDDANLCTTDSCDAKLGCAQLATAATCSDDNACTLGDACTGGVCLAGAVSPCDDGSPCTTNACVPGKGCNLSLAPDGTSCPIGACLNGVCEAPCSEQGKYQQLLGTASGVWAHPSGLLTVVAAGKLWAWQVKAGNAPIPLWSSLLGEAKGCSWGFTLLEVRASPTEAWVVASCKVDEFNPYWEGRCQIFGMTDGAPGGWFPCSAVKADWVDGHGWVPFDSSSYYAKVGTTVLDTGVEEDLFGVGGYKGDRVAAGASIGAAGLNNIWITRLGPGTEVKWGRTYPAPVQEVGLAAATDKNGNLVIVFRRWAYALGLLTLDGDGNVLGKRMLGGFVDTLRMVPFSDGFWLPDSTQFFRLDGQVIAGSLGAAFQNAIARLPDGRYAAISGATGKHSLVITDAWGFSDCPSAGYCGNKSIDACDDGNLCTPVSCSAAKGCLALGAWTNCEDYNPCTADACSPTKGCVGTPLADGTPCGKGLCTAGVCHLYASAGHHGSVATSNCALDGTGAPWCWGENSYGQSSAATPGGYVGIPSQHPAGVSGLVKVSMGYHHSCGVTGDGKVACWGDGSLLGDPGVTGKGKLAWPAVDEVTDVQVGEKQTCALRKDGFLWCWSPEYGVKSPTKVTLPADVSQVAQGAYSTCALDKQGVTWCAVTYNPLSGYKQVPQLPKATKLCNGGYFRCVVSAADPKHVACIGNNDSGALGDPAITSEVQASGLDFAHPITQLACSNFRVCAVDAKGQVWCWGDNGGGECKVPVSAKTAQPTLQTRIKQPVVQLHLGYEYMTVRLPDGSLQSWGRPYGLGNGGTASDPLTAVVVPVTVLEPGL